MRSWIAFGIAALVLSFGVPASAGSLDGFPHVETADSYPGGGITFSPWPVYGFGVYDRPLRFNGYSDAELTKDSSFYFFGHRLNPQDDPVFTGSESPGSN